METLISVLAWVESTALSQWILGSQHAFPIILTLHAIGMAVAVGFSVMVDLRVLGFAPGVPLAELQRFLPAFWSGFGLNVLSGVLLLIGYPTKALTNPVFYLKLGLIVVAMLLLTRIANRAFGQDAENGSDEAVLRSLRRLAIVSLVCWAGAIATGRLLAYTYRYLTALEY